MARIPSTSEACAAPARSTTAPAASSSQAASKTIGASAAPSYLVRRVELGSSSRFDSTPSTSLVLNPRGQEDVRLPMSFGSAPLRARWVPLAFAGIQATPLDSSEEAG